MIATTSAYADKMDGFIESLQKKLKGYSGERAMRTPRQRKQASEARYEAHNIQLAIDACRTLAEAERNGTLPPSLYQWKTMSGIIQATSVRMSCGSGYYAEVYPDHDNFKDDSPEARKLREWLSGGSVITDEEREERARQQMLANLLSEVRGGCIDGFFPTPDKVIDEMFFGLEDALDGATVLEPSAGIGSLADRAKSHGANVICFEVNHKLCEILNLKGHTYIHDDFLECEVVQEFGYVFMNPPFENDLAPVHVQHAFDFLIPTGELVAIMPQIALRYNESERRKRREFADWLSDKDHRWMTLPEGSFKDAFRSTAIETVMLWIKK